MDTLANKLVKLYVQTQGFTFLIFLLTSCNSCLKFKFEHVQEDFIENQIILNHSLMDFVNFQLGNHKLL